MYTIEYKGAYIHGFCDKTHVRVQYFLSGEYLSKECKSLHAAKCLITRRVNRGC